MVSIGLLTELMREQPLPAALEPILARVDAGAVEVRAARIALRPLMERAIGDEAEAARRKGIVLRIRSRPFIQCALGPTAA